MRRGQRAGAHAIETYLAAHNENPQPFQWTATTDQILEKIRRGRVTLNAPSHGLRSRNRLLAALSTGGQLVLALDETQACRRVPVARSRSESSVSSPLQPGRLP